MKHEALNLTQTLSVPLEPCDLAFQQDVQKGIPARPQQANGRGVRGWYGEVLSDVRTPPETFSTSCQKPLSLTKVAAT